MAVDHGDVDAIAAAIKTNAQNGRNHRYYTVRRPFLPMALNINRDCSTLSAMKQFLDCSSLRIFGN
eukprot:scaffold119863_cov94-Cyclotella_meneghiniana.AAC.1